MKNGSRHNRQQKHKFYDCGIQFVENSTNQKISSETKDMVAVLLLEKISLAGIKYANTPRKVQVFGKTKGKRAIECDEIWSDCESKKKHSGLWGWL